MSKFNEITTMAYIKGEAALNKAKNAVMDFNKDERGVEGFVVALILIGIAALLAVAFKDQIEQLMNGLITKIKTLLGITE